MQVVVKLKVNSIAKEVLRCQEKLTTSWLGEGEVGNCGGHAVQWLRSCSVMVRSRISVEIRAAGSPGELWSYLFISNLLVRVGRNL